MRNSQIYTDLCLKIQKYNFENDVKIGVEVHSKFDFFNSESTYIDVDIYTALDYSELQDILLSFNIGNFILKIFNKYPKKKRSFSLRILKNKL